MKLYEQIEAGRRLLPGVPLMARIDGKCFSKWTRGLARPYDERLSRMMVETTRFLVEESQAIMGYTQSDEITLVFSPSNVFFDGKVQKMTSVLASMATMKFNELAPLGIPEKKGRLALFDARAWAVPSTTEATNAVLWREFDATKNAISMAARSCYSHKQLHGLNGSQMQELLFQKGINFKDYPAFFKRGTYVQRRRRLVELSLDELAKIPEKYRPEGPVERWRVEELDMPPLAKVTNRVDVMFEGADPVLIQEDSPPV